MHKVASMTTYRAKIEEQIIKDLGEWLDTIEEQYGPAYALEAYAFVGAVGFTPEGEEPEAGASFARSAIGYHCSDSRAWAQVGILRGALEIAESDEE
jgi:hypothetical protein